MLLTYYQLSVALSTR